MITAGLTNNGVLGKSDVKAKLFGANTITVDMFGCAFYRQFQYKMVTHARVFSLSPTFCMTQRQGLFIANAMSYFRSLFGYENMCSWEKIKSLKISLPQNNEGDIDFAFMESFVRELEESRLRELEAYLNVTGLKNYHLTPSDLAAIQNFSTLKWKEFRVGDLFERISTKKLPFKAKELPQQPEGDYTLPCLTSSFMNQGLNYFAPRKDATILSNVISIPSNSDVYRAYYQSNDFTVLSDAYAIRWKENNNELGREEYLFFVTCINQITDLPIYSYKNKLGGWNVVKDKYIMLPVNDTGRPNLPVMGQFVSAIQKVVIADVAKYTESKLSATRQIVINNNKKRIIHKTYFPGSLPFYSVRAACGYFEESGTIPKNEAEGWVDVSDVITKPSINMFIVRASGDSMNPLINDGDFCVFELYGIDAGGTRDGEVVLAQCLDQDDDYGCSYTIKKYHSEKAIGEDGSWHHTKIVLKPINVSEYKTIEITEELDRYHIVGILKKVL